MKKLLRCCFVLIFLLPVSGLWAQVIQGTYAIKNMQTGMLLRVKDASNKNGTPLVAYSPVNWKCVTWDFKHIDSNTYQLKNLLTGKTFQPKSTAPAEGAVFEEQPLVTAQSNQLYEFIQVQKNVYLIKQKNTDLYITPADKDGAENSAILLAKKTGTKLQQWTIYLQEPTM